MIEDALYAELQYATPLRPTVKACDRDGWVILCTSTQDAGTGDFASAGAKADATRGASPNSNSARRSRSRPSSAKCSAASSETAATPSICAGCAASTRRRSTACAASSTAPSRPERAPPNRPAASCCGSNCRRRAASTACATSALARHHDRRAACSRRPDATAGTSAVRLRHHFSELDARAADARRPGTIAGRRELSTEARRAAAAGGDSGSFEQRTPAALRDVLLRLNSDVRRADFGSDEQAEQMSFFIVAADDPFPGGAPRANRRRWRASTAHRRRRWRAASVCAVRCRENAG